MALGANGDANRGEEKPEPPPATPDIIEEATKPEPQPATQDVLIKMLTREESEGLPTPPTESECEDES